MPEWTTFDFSTSGNVSVALAEVNHVVHFPDARRIVDEGQISWRSVHDESRLKRTRTHVCWVSSNTWDQGSFYGTIELMFPWKALIKEREIYWIEAIERYNPTAVRFLITSRGKPPIAEAKLYDPNTEAGPLKRIGGIWYRNREVNTEFLIEDSLALGLCSKIRFIAHHPNICRLNGNSCPEITGDWTKSAAQLIGYLLGTRNTDLNSCITPDIGLPNGKLNMMNLRGAVSGLFTGIALKSEFGGKISAGRSARYLVRAAALQFAMGDEVGARKTASLLSSGETFDNAVNEVIAKHFNVPSSDFD